MQEKKVVFDTKIKPHDLHIKRKNRWKQTSELGCVNQNLP